MTEEPKGVYTGTYVVEPDVVKQKVKVIVVLTDPAGNESRNESEQVFLLSVDTVGKLFLTFGHLKTMLYQNYPNPFNPETWIPYQLAEDSNITLTIYNTTGQIVRIIQVGHKPAAVYDSKDKAIYWDGRGETGEKVSSGIYYYLLTTSTFSATRKMLILK